MSYAMPGEQHDGPRQRPGTVTAATWLLLLIAVVFVVSAVAMLAVSGTLADAYREAYEGFEEFEDLAGAYAATNIIGAVLQLLFGAGFAVLALFNHRGSNPSRIVTWVAGGLALCCVGAGLVSAALLSGVQVDAGESPDPTEVRRIVDEALPGWYDALTTTTTLVALPALVAVIILLALPPSNRYFRKQPAGPPPGGPPYGYPPPGP